MSSEFQALIRAEAQGLLERRVLGTRECLLVLIYLNNEDQHVGRLHVRFNSRV